MGSVRFRVVQRFRPRGASLPYEPYVEGDGGPQLFKLDETTYGRRVPKDADPLDEAIRFYNFANKRVYTDTDATDWPEITPKSITEAIQDLHDVL